MEKGKLNLEWAQHFITQGFSSLEKIVSSTSGKYCVGNEISLADLALVPQVANCKKFVVFGFI